MCMYNNYKHVYIYFNNYTCIIIHIFVYIYIYVHTDIYVCYIIYWLLSVSVSDLMCDVISGLPITCAS